VVRTSLDFKIFDSGSNLIGLEESIISYQFSALNSFQDCGFSVLDVFIGLLNDEFA